MYESMMAKRTMQESDVPEAAFSENSYLTPEEYSFCDIPAMELSIDEILPYFDWRMFLAIWGIKYGGDLPDDPIIEKTVKDGKAVLERFKTRHEVIIRLSERIMNARREGNDIVISGESTRFPMLRQANVDAHSSSRLSLADFVPSGHDGPMGTFAISVVTNHGPACTCGCQSGLPDFSPEEFMEEPQEKTSPPNCRKRPRKIITA